MRVWVVSELFYPEDTSTGHYLTRIAEELATEFEVAALVAQPTYASRGTRAPRRERYRGVDVIRCRATAFDKDKLPLRALNAATLTGSFFVNAVRRIRKGDVVLFVTNPPTLPPVLLAACRVRGARSVLLVHDVYPQALVAAGMVRDGSASARTILAANRAVLRGVDRVIAIGRDMASLVATMAGGAVKPIFIPNWSDLDDVRPAPRRDNAILRELGLETKFVVQYAGNMGRTHGVEAVVEAAHVLAARDDIHFVFAGFGAKRKWLEGAASQMKNVTLLQRQPRERLNELLTACDVSVVSLAAGMSGVSVPSRMYNVLASGRPMLAMAAADSEPATIVAEEGAGWRIDPGDVPALVAAITAAAADPQLVASMGERARRAAETRYSPAIIAEQYRAVIRSLADAGQNANLKP